MNVDSISNNIRTNEEYKNLLTENDVFLNLPNNSSVTLQLSQITSNSDISNEILSKLDFPNMILDNDEQSFETLKSRNSHVNLVSEKFNHVKNEGNCDSNFSPYIINHVFWDGKKRKSFKCLLCSREFKHMYTLTRHMTSHTNERKYQCNECGKAFRQISTLNQHRVIHSQNRPFSCEVCRKSFNRISSLISHRNTHSNEKSYSCPICSKGFHQKGNLRNHVYTHTNERPYVCDICQKGFNQMSNLNCHKQKVHANIFVSKWSCKICSTFFEKRNQLRAHEIEIHQNEVFNIKPSNNKIAFNADGVILPSIKSMQPYLNIENEPFAVLELNEQQNTLVHILNENEQFCEIRPASQTEFEEISNSTNFLINNQRNTTIEHELCQKMDDNVLIKYESHSPKQSYTFLNINDIENVAKEKFATTPVIDENTFEFEIDYQNTFDGKQLSKITLPRSPMHGQSEIKKVTE